MRHWGFQVHIFVGQAHIRLSLGVMHVVMPWYRDSVDEVTQAWWLHGWLLGHTGVCMGGQDVDQQVCDLFCICKFPVWVFSM